MRIVKIGQFFAKLRTFENREKLQKMMKLRGFGKNRSFFVIFRDFQRTDRF